jgi:hypothetical protein
MIDDKGNISIEDELEDEYAFGMNRKLNGIEWRTGQWVDQDE